jgi:hypothetical protein
MKNMKWRDRISILLACISSTLHKLFLLSRITTYGTTGAEGLVALRGPESGYRIQVVKSSRLCKPSIPGWSFQGPLEEVHKSTA